MEEINKTLDELGKEIENLQENIGRNEAIKKSVSRQKKISHIIESVAPLSHIFVATAFALMYRYNRDENFYKREYLKMKTVMDNTGVIEVVNQFDEFNENNNVLYYYGKWEINEDGKFTRAIKVYNIKPSKYGLSNILDGKVENLDEVFGSPISSQTQQKSTISKVELEKKPYLKAILYNESTLQYETRLIPVEEFSRDTILTLLSCLSVEAFMYLLIKYVKKVGDPTDEVVDELNSYDDNEDNIKKLQMLK